MVLIYWKYEVNKILQLRKIYKNLHWLQIMFQQIYLPPWKMKLTPGWELLT